MSPICDDCLEPYSSEGDCSGLCQSCRESFDEQLMIDEMSEDEYRAYRDRIEDSGDLGRVGDIAAHRARSRSLRITQSSLTNALLGVQRSIRKVA